MLGLTSKWWLPRIPIWFGLLEANSDAINDLSNLATIATFLIVVGGGILAYFGFRNLQGAGAAGEGQQTADVGSGGRGAAVGGDVSGGSTVVVGDHNRVGL